MTINVLLSYAYHSDTDLADVRRGIVCGSVMLDSGAFTAHTMGKAVSLRAYADYLTRWQGEWDSAVTLDVIGDAAGTRRNTRRLLDEGLPVMPVFTRGESLAEFDAMVDECGYVCVGGGIGMSGKTSQERVRALQQRAAGRGGGIHALGLGGIEGITRARPFSGDSSNAQATAQYGKVQVFTGRTNRSIQVSDKPKVRRHWQLLRDHGVDVAVLGMTGRLPSGEQDATCNHLADTCADEWLRSTGHVAPPKPTLTAGPHLYSAIKNHPAALLRLFDLDYRLHHGYCPPIWARYGQNHTCKGAA